MEAGRPGAIPPLTESAWQRPSTPTRRSPNITELKRGMSLEAFKTIYWWEWAHRFLGRLIGVAFLLPFLAFWIAGYIPRALLPRLAGLFVLGGLQGAVGWYMVKSGLVDARRCEPIPARRRISASPSPSSATRCGSSSILGGERAGVTQSGSRASAWVAGTVLALIYLQILAGASRGRARRRLRLQHLAADQRRLRAERPRRGTALGT